MTSLLTDTPTSHQVETLTPAQSALRADPNYSAQRLYPDRKPVEVAAPRSAEIQKIRASGALDRQIVVPIHAYGPIPFNASSGVVNAEAPLSQLALALNPMSTNAALQKNVHELALIARDAGMNVDDVRTLTAAINSLVNTETPPTALQAAAGGRRAISKMRVVYASHPGGFDRVLADAMTVSKRDPMLAKILDTTGANTHEDVILMFARLGIAARNRGELK